MRLIEEFLLDESGATAVEYGLAATLVSIVAIIGMADTGQEINNLYSSVEGAVDGAVE